MDNAQQIHRLLASIKDYDARMGAPFNLEGDCVIVGDTHAPFTDYDFAMKVAQVGRKHLRKPRKLRIVGDYWDFSNFSAYAAIITPPTWAQERQAAKDLLKYWLEVFDEIDMTMGNHERRLQKFTMGMFDVSDILSLIYSNPDRVRLSNFGWCTLQANGIKYRLTHPRNYSINQLVVAEQLALKHNTNIISFHEHHLGKGWDRYGNHVIINGGCLVDDKKLAYVALDDSKSDQMKRGFVLVKNGIAEPLGEAPFTDWSKWL